MSAAGFSSPGRAHVKDPQAAVDFEVDWLAGGVLRPQEAIASSSWLVAPVEVGGLVVDSTEFSGRVAGARVSGGVPGHLYRLTNRIVTTRGAIEDESFTVRCEES